MLFVRVNKFIEKINWRGENDIYIVLKFNNENRRTISKMDDNEPEWNETFLFDMITDGELIVEIWDYDKWGANNMKDAYSIFVENIGEPITHIVGPVSITFGDIYYTHINDKNILKNKYMDLETKFNDIMKKYNIVHDNQLGMVTSYNTLYNEHTTSLEDNIKLDDTIKKIKGLNEQILNCINN
jgi:hypothetical protein